jgi:hypothetical protein
MEFERALLGKYEGREIWATLRGPGVATKSRGLSATLEFSGLPKSWDRTAKIKFPIRR